YALFCSAYSRPPHDLHSFPTRRSSDLYTPGFQDIRTWTTGGQGAAWLNDYIRFGVTTSSNDAGVGGSRLRGADVTLRKSTDSWRSEEHTSELQSRFDLVCRLLLEKKNT